MIHLVCFPSFSSYCFILVFNDELVTIALFWFIIHRFDIFVINLVYFPFVHARPWIGHLGATVSSGVSRTLTGKEWTRWSNKSRHSPGPRETWV